METKLQIINLGLAKIGTSRISSLSPAKSSLEKFMSESYEHWKRTEIAKRRWVFAMDEAYALSQIDTLEDVERPNIYLLPPECLRPIRRDGAEWIQRKREIHSAYPDLKIPMILNVDEDTFDPFMAEVLACRVAVESAEYVTQSNTKKQAAVLMYKEAVRDASKNNAFVIGPERISDSDEAFEFITSRW